MNKGIIGTICIILLLVDKSYVEASPVGFVDKPPNCPYGKCFIDRCKRICSCYPKEEGRISCTKPMDFFRTPTRCVAPNGNDNCPLGKTYKDPIWPKNFLCYCNNDSSQTYECFDLNAQTHADPAELADITKMYKKLTQLKPEIGVENRS